MLGREMIRKTFTGSKTEIERGRFNLRCLSLKVDDGERQYVKSLLFLKTENFKFNSMK